MAKKNTPEHPVLKALPNITLVLASLVTISNFVKNEFIHLNVWVVLAFLLACWLYALYVLRPQRTNARGAQHRPQRKWVSYLPVIGLPLLMIVVAVYQFKGEPACTEPSPLPSIGVADFEEGTGGQDFSTELITTLREKARSAKEPLEVKYISSFFDLKAEEELLFRKLEESARANCIAQGLVIYGRWEEKQNYPLYRGYFYIQESKHYQQSVALHPRRVLDSLHYDIKMPKEFKFEMPRYTDSLANAALAIVKIYGGAYAEARKLLQPTETAYGQPVFKQVRVSSGVVPASVKWKNEGLSSIFEFYLATIDVIEGNIESAKKRYQRSYGLDTANGYAMVNYEYLSRIAPVLHANDSPVDTAHTNTQRSPSGKKAAGGYSVPPAETTTAPVVKIEQKPASVMEKIGVDSMHTAAQSAAAENHPERKAAGKIMAPLAPEIVKVDEHSSATFESKGFEEVLIFTENRKFGIWDRSKNVLTDRLYDRIGAGNEGFLKVMLNAKMGFITVKGRPITPMKYEAVRDFHEGMAAVQSGGKWGFINREGIEIIGCKYASVVQDFSQGTALVSNGGKKAVRIDNHGREIGIDRRRLAR